MSPTKRCKSYCGIFKDFSHRREKKMLLLFLFVFVRNCEGAREKSLSAGSRDFNARETEQTTFFLFAMTTDEKSPQQQTEWSNKNSD
jgi:hypothetical protein